MVNYPVIRVIVPTLNNADELDATVESLLAQDYDDNKLFIAFVDFGSTDGTQEKLLRYRKKQTGIFSLAGKRIGRTMIADAARMYDFQRIGSREFVLWPGDIIYPHCFKTAENWLHTAEREKKHSSMLVAEADIRGQDGVVRKQTPLFTGPCHLRSHSVDSAEYAVRGYKHTVLAYGHTYSTLYTKGHTQHNQRHIWNHLAYLGMGVNTVYINESLGCLKERLYADELDEILFFFEAGLTCFRMAKERPADHMADARFEPGYRNQLARYALWRAYLLYNRGRHKEAEDCFLFAGVIWPGIYEEACWRTMERLLEQGEEADQAWLEDYFSREEPSAEPKWPVGERIALAGPKGQTTTSAAPAVSIWRIIWRMLRQHYGREKQSAWGR